jgi:hypothetical protein
MTFMRTSQRLAMGVLRLCCWRVQGLDARGQADLIRSVYTQCETALIEGAAVSADRQSIRLRRPPLK